VTVEAALHTARTSAQSSAASSSLGNSDEARIEADKAAFFSSSSGSRDSVIAKCSCNTPNGAYASAVLYSIVETAKENGLDARAYIEYILDTFKDADIASLDLADYMPWSPTLPAVCRTSSKDNAV